MTVAAAAAAPNNDDKHSISRRLYTIHTPMVQALTAELTSWIRYGSAGGIIYGRPRVGKSVACRIARAVMQEQFPNLGIVTIDFFNTSHKSSGSFFGDLLREVGHSFPHPGSDGQKRERFLQHLCTIVEKQGGDRCLIFIDEAHRLGEAEYESLLDVHNWLASRAINLAVILVGQADQMLDVRTGFRRRQLQQILGRFMCLEHQFFGLRRPSELGAILDCYDIGSEYPRDSRISFTQHFLPELFNNGWRLKPFTKVISTAFAQTIEDEGLGEQYKDIPLLYVCRCIEAILIHLRDRPKDADKVELKLVMSLIALTGFPGSIRNLKKP